MTEWWRGGVLYQIYPRSFCDSDGDGVGDLEGIVSRLDHVAGLGVDGIWLSPFFRSPMMDFGYDVADYRDVDPLFGTLDGFDRLLARAHGLGLKVVIDMVLSHTSDSHPWFRDSRAGHEGPRADWYVWADAKADGTPPNNWLSVFGGPAWTWDGRRQQYYLHNFLACQPDLNLHNPEVQEAVLGECAFWLDRGVDGFRLDVANYYLHDPMLRDNPPRPPGLRWPDGVPPASPYGRQIHRHDKSQPETLWFLRRLRALLDRYPDRMAVAEVHDDDSVMRAAEYVAAPDLLHTAYNFALLGTENGAATIRAAVEAFEAQPGQGWPSWAFSNHDVPRVASRWGGPDAPAAAARLYIALLTALRGTAFLYQGEELGLPQAEVPFERLRDPFGIALWPEAAGRDGCRTPMPWSRDGVHAGFSDVEPWLPIPDEHRARAVAVQEGDPDSVLAFTRVFLAWRAAQPALRLGTIRFRDVAPPVLAFEREHDGQALLCLFNPSPEPARAAVADADRWLPLSVPGLDGAPDDGAVRLGPWGALFARRRE
ncbi:alpha-glucosidase family protein [Azospirillum halopraeferens]|uniref:alpha-glucosidase family protein n=1 Tax=Azospirillum halopraeferens TaxID=34010 RepID=UPI000414409C|nr:alpha-glucosidase family protein [Azospirillum halopraeferens]